MKNFFEAINVLMELGLTEIEAMVYTFLLSENPVTGYRIAQSIGKPVANIYKSLSSLESKGAVIFEDDNKRLYKPVPLKEFLQLLEGRFLNQKVKAEKVLTSLENISEDEKVYQLRSVEQIFERIRSMLKRAKKTVLIDAFPWILNEIKTDLNGIKRKDLEIVIKAYQPIGVEGVKVILDSRGPEVLDDYPGEWLKLVIDGKEFLLVLLSKGGGMVFQAVWSSSIFLSLIHHQGILSEVLLDKAGEWANRNNQRELTSLLADYALTKKKVLPGYLELVKQFSKGKKV